MMGGDPQGGALEGHVHRMALRVYYEDTDFSGVVYHASYLRFLERGRTELLRALGVHQDALHEGGQGVAFVVRRMTIDWLKPARMDDVLTIETGVGAIGGASADLVQRVLRGGEELVTARVLVAALAGGRAQRLPPQMRAAMSGLIAL